MTKCRISRIALAIVLGLTSIFAFGAATSQAAAAPKWLLNVNAETSAEAGTELRYHMQLTNIGETIADGTTGDPIVFTVSLPPQVTIKEIGDVIPFPPPLGPILPWNSPFVGWSCSGDGSGSGGVEGAHSVECAISGQVEADSRVDATRGLPLNPIIEAELSGGATGSPQAIFALSGAGAPAVGTAAVTRVTAEPPRFGIHGFDGSVTEGDGASPDMQAAGHPSAMATRIDFDTRTNENPGIGEFWPVAPPRDISVALPPGLLGNPTAVPRCDLAGVVSQACPPETEIGGVELRVDGKGGTSDVLGPLALFNIEPPDGVPAQFAFNYHGTVGTLNARVRSSEDYGVSVDSTQISEGLPLAGITVDLWGTPAAGSHDSRRACSEEDAPEYAQQGKTCLSTAAERPFLRNPTACTGRGAEFRLSTDSWFEPGAFLTDSFRTHSGPGAPFAPANWGPEIGFDGCADVPFHPSLEASTTTNVADSPSGLDLHLRVPQDCWQHPEELCSSDLRDAEVTLPQGMSLNPSAASGLGACSASQIGLITPVGQSSPIHFDESAASCPDSSKIGKVTITTPLLEAPLSGSVYLARQGENPFGSLLAMYLVAEGSGVVIKQAGEIVTGPGGRLTTVFKDAPQQPFSDLHVELFGGTRAPLRTPATCGTYAIGAKLAPWSGNATVNLASGFEIDSCPNAGFDPKLNAGTQNPLAGSYSPFRLRLTRGDGTQEITKLDETLPQGLLGAPAGIPYCPDSVLASFPAEPILGAGAGEEAHSSCPAASQLGAVTVGAGAGVNPFYTQSGKAYLAGPYKGAPLSIAVLAPAVAGPFDLGTVLVRNAVQVDPETAQISVASDPLPTIVHGIPLDLRDVRVSLNRPNFTLNPTSCEPSSIGSTVTSAQGATAHPSSPFQAASCDRLGFKPKLSLRLRGGVKRSDHPALTAVLTPRQGDANVAGTVVALPHSEFLAQNHIKTICTRVQFAAGGGGGEQCPPGSVYGKVSATSPILGYPLYGNIYLRSSANPLPDMVLALHGPSTQPLQVDAVGRIDSVHGGIRTTFASVPDAPLSKVVLQLPGGKKSLLENSRDLCASTSKASVAMTAHNGRTAESTPTLRVKCPKAPKAKKHHKGR